MPWIVLSFVVALVLDSISLGAALQPYNPPWTLMVLIYWCWIVPAQIGMIAGFCVGVMLDTLDAGVLGVHALGAAFIGYLAHFLRPMFSTASLSQQAVIVWGLVLIYKAVVGWVQGLFGPTSLGMTYWLASLVVLPVWPIVYTLLKELIPIKRRA